MKPSATNRSTASTAATRAARLSAFQSGYALMMVMFMAAVMIIGAVTINLTWLTQGKRQKEAEMIWRGDQYKRGVRLYYHKVGKFPQTMDDLTKGNGTIHFMRKAYKDPTTPDGNWRMIYVTPAGQLVNSVRYTSLQQMAAAEQMAGAGPPADPSQQPGTPAASAFGQPSTSGPGGTGMGGSITPGGQQPGSDPGGTGNPGQQPLSGPGGQQGQTPIGTAPLGGNTFNQPQFSLSGGSTGGGQTFGGSIIGVGGSADKKSVMVYKGGKTYHRWEFIWNPLSDVIGQANQGVQGAQGLQPPQSPAGGGIVPLPSGTPQNPTTPPPQ